ncbi:hypothetical protein ACQ4WX_38790 [Streptomyces lasalocidi]
MKNLLLATAAVGCLLLWPTGSHDQVQQSTVTNAVLATDVTWGP